MNYDMSMEEIEAIAVKTEGYSGSDMAGVIKEAAQGNIYINTFLDFLEKIYRSIE